MKSGAGKAIAVERARHSSVARTFPDEAKASRPVAGHRCIDEALAPPTRRVAAAALSYLRGTIDG